MFDRDMFIYSKQLYDSINKPPPYPPPQGVR